jgi:hypothetical protein
VLVLRTAPAIQAPQVRVGGGMLVELGFGEGELKVQAGGRSAATLRARAAAPWDEWVLRVPGELVRAERTRIEVAGRYASFHWWAYQ